MSSQEKVVYDERYLQTRQIAKGNYSVVYEGFDLKTKKRIAIKRIKTLSEIEEDCKLEADCEFELKLNYNPNIAAEKEINILRMLDHPKVIKYIGSFSYKSVNYIVTELAEGMDLDTYLYVNNPIAISLFWSIALQLLEIIYYLHN